MSIDTILWALLFIVAFWIAVFFINQRYNLKKRGIEVSPGVLMWRTKRGLGFIDRVARGSKQGWRVFGTIGATSGFILMMLVFVLFAQSATFILQQPEAAPPGAMPPIPGVTIPLLYGLIALFSVLIIHEFAHGFVMRAQGLRTKSTGVWLLIAIPGAFVEQDEKQLKKAPMPKRLRVYGAGSLANILFALLCLGILLLAVSPKPGVYVYDTVKSYYVTENTVENGASWGLLQPGDCLLEINHVADNVVASKVTINDYEDFHNFMENTKENDNLLVLVERGGRKENFLITLTQYPENENKGYMGVLLTYARGGFLYYMFNPVFEMIGYRHLAINSYSYDAHVPWVLIDLLRWLIFLHFGVGLFNLLPMKPLDGGHIASGVVERVSSKRVARYASNVLAVIVLVFLIINFAPIFW